MDMEKQKIQLSECQPGDIIAQDIFNESGSLLITEHTAVNSYILDKLYSIGMKEVLIFKRSHQRDVARQNEEYIKWTLKYEDNVHSIKEVINDLAYGKALNYEKITEMSDALIGEIHNRNGIIQCLSTIRDFDVYTYCHSINVALYSMLVARWIRLSAEEIKEVVLAGLLHDIGKSQIPSGILNKKGKLDDTEFDIMKKHPVYGYNLAKQTPKISKEVLKAILMHHEREDGTGYPLCARSDQQGLYTKIVAIADVYDALTSERVYKQRITPFETFKIIERTGLGHFDTRILMTFLHNIASYYIGSGVVMSNGKKGTVVFVSSNCISSPIVLVEDKCIDLSRETELKILCMEN